MKLLRKAIVRLAAWGFTCGAIIGTELRTKGKDIAEKVADNIKEDMVDFKNISEDCIKHFYGGE